MLHIMITRHRPIVHCAAATIAHRNRATTIADSHCIAISPPLPIAIAIAPLSRQPGCHRHHHPLQSRCYCRLPSSCHLSTIARCRHHRPSQSQCRTLQSCHRWSTALKPMLIGSQSVVTQTWLSNCPPTYLTTRYRRRRGIRTSYNKVQRSNLQDYPGLAQWLGAAGEGGGGRQRQRRQLRGSMQK
jgi:hypothetical protein